MDPPRADRCVSSLMDKATLTLPHAGPDSVFSRSARAAEGDGLRVGGSSIPSVFCFKLLVC